MKQVFSGILALVVFLTSTGFTVSSHSCGGEVVKTSVSIVNTDVSCGMESETMLNGAECDSKEKLNSNCCHNEYHKVQMEDEFDVKQNFKGLNFTFVAAFLHTFINQFDSFVSRVDNFSYHAPPLITKDIQLVVQSFLI